MPRSFHPALPKIVPARLLTKNVECRKAACVTRSGVNEDTVWSTINRRRDQAIEGTEGGW
jgi:hypothetical protein